MKNTLRYKIFGTPINIEDVIDNINKTGQKEIRLEPKIVGYIQDYGVGMPMWDMRGELKGYVGDKKINLTKYIYRQLNNYEGFGSREKHTEIFMDAVEIMRKKLATYGIDTKIMEPQQV